MSEVTAWPYIPSETGGYRVAGISAGGKFSVSNDKRDGLDVLKFELAFLEQGGYGRSVRTPWKATSVFQDSPSCLNFNEPAARIPVTSVCSPTSCRAKPGKRAFLAISFRSAIARQERERVQRLAVQ